MSISEFHDKVKLNAKFPYKIEFSNTPQRMLPHWHEEVEFMYFYDTSGCEYLCHGELIQVNKGDLIIANSCEVHECFDFGANASVCCLITSLNAIGCENFQFKNKYHSAEISAFFERLLKIKNQENFQLEVMSAIYGVLANLSKEKIEDFTFESTTNIARIRDALKYINNNLSLPIKVNDLAELVSLSDDGFYHIFKKITGISPSIYILEQRLIKAQKLLKDTDFSISEIAEECGFCTPSYFAEKFKEICGTSPGKFRKEH